MILVDTSIWIDFFNGQFDTYIEKFENIIKKEIILIGDLIRIEILQGFKSDKDYEVAKNLLYEYEQVSLVSNETSELSISMYRDLRHKGITIKKTIDTIIASYCILNEIPLLTKDKDFLYYSEYFNLELI